MRSEEFNAAFTILLDALTRFCYHPGKIENCTFIIDTRKFSMPHLPLLVKPYYTSLAYFLKVLQSWMTIGNACFPCSMFKAYVIGPPPILKKSWPSIQSILFSPQRILTSLGLIGKDTVQKIEFVEPSQLMGLQSSISFSQLEGKFGGSLPNLTSFWYIINISKS